MLTIFMTIEAIEEDKDRSFVAEIYEKYAKKMKAVALGILKDDALAEDCVHETVIIIIKKLDSFKAADNESYLKWLILLVCKNTALNMLKKQARKESREFSLAEYVEVGGDSAHPASDSPGPQEIAASDANVRYIVSLINKLDKKYRDVLVLKYRGLSTSDIAQILYISPEAVRQRLSRARTQILEMGGGKLYE